MQLTKDEKEILQAFRKSDTFRILCKIEDEAMTKLARKLSEANFDDPNDVEILKKNKIYMNSRADFFKNTEKYVQEIFSHE